MISEMNFDGKALARGRNGNFYPVKAECFQAEGGKLFISVYSRRAGKAAPIFLQVSEKDGAVFSELIRKNLKGGKP